MVGPSATGALTRVARATQRRKYAQSAADKAEREWRDTIRTAVAAGARVTDIAEAAGVSRERVYQIRDERR